MPTSENDRTGQYFQFHSLSDCLDAVLQLYDEERRAHYEKKLAEYSDEYRARLTKAEIIAGDLFKNMRSLGGPGIVPFVEQLQGAREHAGFGDDKVIFPAIFDALKCSIGSEIVYSCSVAENRLTDLLFLMKRCRISARTTRFLACVSRCYLLGFDAECAVMCRAALDSQFQAEISNDDCIGILGQPRGGDAQIFDLYARITVARRQSRISEQIEELANRVRKEGNDVIHQRPSLSRNSISVIQDTLTVIEALDRE